MLLMMGLLLMMKKVVSHPAHMGRGLLTPTTAGCYHVGVPLSG